MNRLWLRLTVAFVLVTLVGVASVALLAGWNASSQFREYVYGQDEQAQDELAAELAFYYQQRGSWEGIGNAFAQYGPPGMRRPRGDLRSGRTGPAPLIADAGGKVVYDPTGQRTGSTLDERERKNWSPIVTQRGTLVGYVQVADDDRGAITAPDQLFLDQLRSTLVIAALAAGGLGILIGLLFSRTLAAPLAELAGAGRACGPHDWSRRVSVHGLAQTAEVSEVAHAFNDMADALQKAETQRRNLMADVAHELRTPLTVLQGNLRALLDGVYPLERAEIATLYDETRLLSRLVDDLRQLALAEAGQLPLNLQTVDARALIPAISAKFSTAAEERQIALKSDLPAELPYARADGDRLAQVLQNLLSNALRHTASGGTVTLSAERIAAERGPMLRFGVSDTGEGIAPEDLPHIFDRFYRADRSRPHRSGSTGLGLAIAKSFIEAMGGQIGVESRPGQGSYFWFTLPSAAGE